MVDVNKTTFGPPNHLPLPKHFKAIELIALAFERQFVSGHAEPRSRKSAPYATSGQTSALEML